jgi:hypothetical protein
MRLTTPIAFFIFNRPDLTAKVFEAIAQARPEKLLIIADGPRSAEEAEKCRKTRQVVEKIDWDCEVLTNFSDTNLGCKQRVASGIHWVFSQVEMAMLLEDDCLPVPSFFPFCQTMLQRYRDDERIMHIGGCNFLPDRIKIEDSYFFSRYIFPWGWGTWKRAWENYDEDMKSWPEFKKAKMLQSIFENPDEHQFWEQRFDLAFKGEIDTWDFQWFYNCWSQGGLAISPSVNMVSNLGFQPDATHTKTAHEAGILANRPAFDMAGSIRHPEFIVERREADAYMFEACFRPDKTNHDDTIRTKLYRYGAAIKRKANQFRTR